MSYYKHCLYWHRFCVKRKLDKIETNYENVINNLHTAENNNHNKKVLDSLCPGDRVEFKRGIYSHWGIYLGDGKIIHLTGDVKYGIDDASHSTHFPSNRRFYKKAFVRIDSFWDVVKRNKAYINNSYDNKKRPFDPEEIIANAANNLGEYDYNLILSNCEHFTNQCRYGVKKSEQVEKVFTFLGCLFILNKWFSIKRRMS